MTDETCGYETSGGTPCELPACRDDGRCWHHTDLEEPEDVGRPTKLTYERQEQIARAIEEGKSMNSAARMAGVTPQTVHNWMERGEGEEEGVFAEFFERVARARGQGEDGYFETVLEMAKENGDHRFIASLMKQRYPESWGNTETGVDAADITVNSDVVEVTEETIDQ